MAKQTKTNHEELAAKLSHLAEHGEIALGENTRLASAEDDLALDNALGAVAPQATQPAREGSLMDEVENLRKLVAGRPSLSKAAGIGQSPARNVRLGKELDDELNARVRVEGRKRSEIIRDALELYLHGDRLAS